MNSVATIQINRPILVNNLLEFRSNKQPKLSLFISLDTKCSSANYKPAAVSSFNQVISLHPNNSVEKKLRCWTILEKYRRCHLFVCMCCSLATKQLYAFRQDFTAETIAFRGGSRGRVQGVRTPPPDMKLSSSYIRISFWNFFTSPSVTSFLRGAPPRKKKPGSAPGICDIWIAKILQVIALL